MSRALTIAVLLAGCTLAPPAATPPGSFPPTSLRVVSYNIRHGVGTDERLDLERTAGVLRRLAPDIVALQEVDERVERSGRVDQAAKLGELLGMHHAFGSFMDYQGGRYGVAILARRPIRSVRSIRLRDGNEPRVALAVQLTLPDSAALTVVNVHFDWVAADSFRYSQATAVARFLADLSGPYILLGDFNDEPGSRTLALFQERAAEARKSPHDRFTFSSTEPRKEIDFIFASPAADWTIGPARVIAEPLASDHRPVVAELTYLAARAVGRAPGTGRARMGSRPASAAPHRHTGKP